MYQVPLSAAQPGDVLLCCFWFIGAESCRHLLWRQRLLHHIPEQLSKRESTPTNERRHAHSLWRHRAWHASAFTGICNGLVAVSTFVKTGLKPSGHWPTQLPVFRQKLNEGWYQVRIAGRDAGEK